MKRVLNKFASMLVIATALGSSAQAAVITAPVALTSISGGWNYSGLGFVANRDSVLTHFQYQNGGRQAEIDLFDASGATIGSLVAPATWSSTGSAEIDVSWALASGTQYYLLAHATDNRYANYGGDLFGNEDITLTDTGIFSTSVQPLNGITGTAYWAGFSEVTTSQQGAAVPEPASLLSFGAGFLALMRLNSKRRASRKMPS